MQHCVFWFNAGFCALLKNCKCKDKKFAIEACRRMKYTLDNT